MHPGFLQESVTMIEKTVRNIVEEWLKDNGYDGLYDDDCGCLIGDIAPCEPDGGFGCMPGYKGPCDPKTCPADGECDWHVGPRK